MEPNQVHVVAAAVSCDSQQIIHALEPRFTARSYVTSVMVIGAIESTTI